MTYAFTFDASACSGCKACQIACKDKNNLPVGVLWRRVYEVSGGSWQQQGSAWTTDVFAYNLSIACNHCVHPKCAGVCPVDAYVVRPDGIVYIDESKCVGCGYCSWACPYSAPRYNPELRHMMKCNFCFDNLDAGLPPACVAACPLRVLDIVTVDDGPTMVGSGLLPAQGLQPLWNIPGPEHPFPLPTFSRTQPHLGLKAHLGMVNELEKEISNWEEIKPQSTPRKNFLLKGFGELPLIIFTLCGQMAAGMALFSFFLEPFSIPILITLGGLIVLGGLASLAHLGAPLNAWRTLNHLKKSWLSREILLFGLFGASWLTCLFIPGMGKLPLALCGIGLVYSMARVYRLRSIPAWDSWRTTAAFFLSAGVLGALAVHLAEPKAWLAIGAGFLLAAEVGVMLSEKNPGYETARKIRGGLILLGMTGAAALAFLMENTGSWLASGIFLIVLAEEIIGRWLFYQRLEERVL
jgi:anaerobic dimethyl sulfoxide reductase subunit B (iron-sulfur subunit)